MKLTYQQKEFVKDKLTPVVIHLNSATKTAKNPISEMIRENGELKNYIGIDYTSKKGADKHLNITLFWGDYDKMDCLEDYERVVSSCKKKHVINIVSDFDLDGIVNQIIEFFERL